VQVACDVSAVHKCDVSAGRWCDRVNASFQSIGWGRLDVYTGLMAPRAFSVEIVHVHDMVCAAAAAFRLLDIPWCQHIALGNSCNECAL
jgi:hypothetical protein